MVGNHTTAFMETAQAFFKSLFRKVELKALEKMAPPCNRVFNFDETEGVRDS